MKRALSHPVPAVYPLAYAARLVGIDAPTARRWVRGYPYLYKGEQRNSAPVMQVAAGQERQDTLLSFEDMLTLRLVRAFREKGLGLPTIKKAASIAAETYGLSNPFVTKAFRSDGKSIFLLLKNRRQARGTDEVLVNALTGQQQFQNVVEPSLFRDVVFTNATTAGSWFPQGKDHSVVIRPDRVFGAPHIKNSGVRTDVISEAVKAEGGDEKAVAAVAAWFKIKACQVKDAVAAEAEWQPRKAA